MDIKGEEEDYLGTYLSIGSGQIFDYQLCKKPWSFSPHYWQNGKLITEKLHSAFIFDNQGDHKYTFDVPEVSASNVTKRVTIKYSSNEKACSDQGVKQPMIVTLNGQCS